MRAKTAASRGLVFMHRNWNAPSELWLARMRDMLEPYTRQFIVRRAGASEWREIPVLSVERQQKSGLERLAGRVGLLPRDPRQLDCLRVRKVCNEPEVEKVFIHFADWAMRYLDVWRELNKPLFVHVHGRDVEVDAYRDDAPGELLHAPGYRDQLFELGQYAHFVANSKLTARKLRRLGIPGDRIHLKYFGVPIPATTRNQAVHEPLEFLFLGRLMEWKGPDLVIQAFNRYRDMGGKGRLVLAGDGPLAARCAQLHADSPYSTAIRRLGAVDAQTGEQLRQQAHVFIAHNRLGPLTGREEAFGVAPVEAMAAGLPVLSGRNGGLIESVADGQTGYLVEPGDIEAQAEQMLQLENNVDLRVELARNARARVGELFTLEAERQRLLQILGLDLGA